MMAARQRTVLFHFFSAVKGLLMSYGSRPCNGTGLPGIGDEGLACAM